MLLTRSLRSLVALAACLVLAGAAQAITYDFAFDSVLANGSGVLVDFGGEYSVQGSITLGSTADTNPSPTSGIYDDITAFALTANGIDLFDVGDIATGFVSVFDDGQTVLGLNLIFESTQIPEADDFEFFRANLVAQFLFDPALASGDTLPTELPDAKKGNLVFIAQVGSGSEPQPKGGGALGIDDDVIQIAGTLKASGSKGRITVGENPIPEPTAAFLFAGGLLVTAHHLRRRR